MLLVKRFAQEILPDKFDNQGVSDASQTCSQGAQNFDALRDIPAWILLGEPGAGKTELFKNEAKICHGLYLTIAEFLHMPEDKFYDKYEGKVLFLDGLDEFRASGENDTIIKIRSRLEKLGRPFFRIACRAADWYGQSDRNDLIRAASNQQLRVFKLCSLGENDILEILESDFAAAKNPQVLLLKPKNTA